MLTSIVLALVAAWGKLVPLGAQAVPAADSARIVRSVRTAQSQFESFRRARFPMGHEFSGPCEIRIGRYCYWRGDESDEAPPVENRDVRERRERLIALLDSAARLVGGDPWIVGQYVRYLVEAGRADSAWRFAQSDCHAEQPWCAALAGYAAHSASRFADADSAFSRALAAMTPDERCRWLDVSTLLDDDLEHRFQAVDCAGREAFVRRVLWLGAPLYSVSTTDLLTEHLARLTRARMAEHSAAPDGEPWADDERELMTRYGWPRWYSRSVPAFGSQIRPTVTGHDAGLPYDFLPSLRTVDHVGQTTRDDWRLDDPRALTGYAPSYARTVHDLPGQLALFRRGDSALVVAAWDVRRDTTLLGRTLVGALVLASEGAIRGMTVLDSAKTVGRIAAAGVLDSGLVSLEVLARDDRRAARLRVGVGARSGERITVSDLLFYSWTGSPALELDAVRDSALASTMVPASRAVGVYWETYGLGARGEPVRFALSVEQIGVSWMRRTAERLRLADPTTGLRIQWTEVPQPHDGVAGRGVRVDLSRLRAGRYSVRLAVSVEGEATTTTTREIEVR